jgi:hypothetical protein
MADLFATGVPDLEMERLYREGDVEGMLRRVQQPLARRRMCSDRAGRDAGRGA